MLWQSSGRSERTKPDALSLAVIGHHSIRSAIAETSVKLTVEDTVGIDGRAVEIYQDVVKFGALLTEGAGMKEPVGITKELDAIRTAVLAHQIWSTYTVTLDELEEALVEFHDDPGGLKVLSSASKLH